MILAKINKGEILLELLAKIYAKLNNKELVLECINEMQEKLNEIKKEFGK